MNVLSYQDPGFTYLVAKQEKSKEKTVEISCQDAQIDGGGTGHSNHNRHEAVQPKHAQGKSHEEQGWKIKQPLVSSETESQEDKGGAR